MWAARTPPAGRRPFHGPRAIPRLDVNQFEYGTFFQRAIGTMTQKFNLSLGARYEGQTNISDHNNIDPRMGFAYQLAKDSRFEGRRGRVPSEVRRKYRRTVTTPGWYAPGADCHPVPDILFGSDLPQFQRDGYFQHSSFTPVRAPELVTPYNINTSLSLEKSLPKGLGLDIFMGRDPRRSLVSQPQSECAAARRTVNPARPGTFLPPDPTKGNINQLESTGTSLSNNYTIGFRQQIRNKWNLNLFGNYTLGNNNSDTDNAFNTPADNYNLRGEWGRSGQDTRHRFFTGTNFRLPWE